MTNTNKSLVPYGRLKNDKNQPLREIRIKVYRHVRHLSRSYGTPTPPPTKETIVSASFICTRDILTRKEYIRWFCNAVSDVFAFSPEHRSMAYSDLKRRVQNMYRAPDIGLTENIVRMWIEKMVHEVNPPTRVEWEDLGQIAISHVTGVRVSAPKYAFTVTKRTANTIKEGLELLRGSLV